MHIKYENDGKAWFYVHDTDDTPAGWMQATFSGIWASCPRFGFCGYFADKNAAILATDEALTA